MDLNRYSYANGEPDSKAVKEDVMELASQLFVDVRNRITKNVLLKCYNYFLIPMYAYISPFFYYIQESSALSNCCIY